MRMRCSYSSCGTWLATLSTDGRLKVFNSMDSTLTIDHLFNASVVSMAWKPSNVRKEDLGHNKMIKSRSRKRKSSQCNGLEATDKMGNVKSKMVNGDDLDMVNGDVSKSSGSRQVSDIIALGLNNGNLVLYSTRMASLVKMANNNGHDQQNNHYKVSKNSVSGLAWKDEKLFYCSLDGHVGAYDGSSGSSSTSKSGFRLKQHRLFSLALGPQVGEGVTVFTGSVSEVLWVDLENKAILATFGSHSSEVRFVNSSNNLVLTCSDKDQSMAVWKCDLEAIRDDADKDKKPSVQNVAMLSVNENILHSDLALEDNSSITVGVLTLSGVFKTFSVDVGDSISPKKRKKPVKPTLTLQIASGDSEGKAKQIEALAISAFHFVSATKVALSYNEFTVFEVVDTGSMDRVTCLTRDKGIDSEHGNKKVINEELRESGVQLKVPDQSKVSVLSGSTSLVDKTSGSKRNEEGNNRKRKGNSENNSQNIDELPMLERLRLLSHDDRHSVSAPRGDSLLQLLIQGLHNRDKKIIESVLDRSDDKLIHSTITKLPIEAIVPLIQELQLYIQGRGMATHSHAKWLRSVLTHHSAFLVSNPNCELLLKPLQSMLEMRTRHFDTLIRLQSKLELITNQLRKNYDDGKDDDNSTVNNAAITMPDVESLIVYQDDSSSDEFTSDIAEHLLPHNEDEDEVDDDKDDEKDAEAKDDVDFVAFEKEEDVSTEENKKSSKSKGSRRKSRRRKSEMMEEDI